MKSERIRVIVLGEGTGRLRLAERSPSQYAFGSGFFDRLHAPVHTFRASGECTWHPFTDVLEERDRFVIRMELAGMDPARLEVLQDGRCLIVRGLREDPWHGSGATCHQIEIPHGPFERVIVLPMDFRSENVHAEYRATGFLEITVRKESA